MSIAFPDYAYPRQRIAEEEVSRVSSRHDSAATIRASSVGPTLPYILVLHITSMADRKQYDDAPTAKPSAAPLPVPTKENDWLGFCQSAIKLQNGDRKVAHTAHTATKPSA